MSETNEQRICDLEADNAKLRELVLDMLTELKWRERGGFGYHSSYFKYRAKALEVLV